MPATRIEPLQELRHRLATADAAPLYQRIAHTLKTAILEGKLYPQGTLPPERELAQGLGVARTTVRKALQQLQEEGLVIRHKGSGSYIAPSIEQPLAKLTSFSQDIARHGLQGGVIWLERERGLPTSEEGFSLGLSPDSEVVRLRRIQTADAQPIALQFTVLPASVLADPHSVDQSLYKRLTELGRHPDRALQTLRGGAATPQEAKLLNIGEGTPVFHIQRLAYCRAQPIELTRSVYRGDRYEFTVEMKA
ncbi:GntR family transcriptional regulator [Deinococcus sp.]|uniref:GntR family transcriptional regulator n=1 Tax=Deinococcus sp. TaxID=47478 RepID=UPI003B59A483